MSNLYDLSRSVELVVHEVIDADGELSSDLEKRLDEVSLNFKDKSANIGRWVLNINSNEAAIELEIARLQKRLKVQDNLRKRLKDYLKFCMEVAGLNKLDLTTFTISIAKNPPSVSEISEEDAEKLPSKYVRIVQTKSIDKKEILTDLKNGVEIPGAYLVTDRTNLRIK